MKKFSENRSKALKAVSTTQKGCLWENSLALDGLNAEETLIKENMEYLHWTRKKVWSYWGSRGTKKVKDRWLENIPRNESEIVDYYNSLELYIPELSSWHSEFTAEIFSRIVGFMQFCIKKGCGSYLDFGSGIGSCGILFYQFGFKVTLSDISNSMLEYSRWRLKRHQIVANYIDLKSSSLPKNCYDCITATEVLEHVVDPVKVISQITASLKTGGYLFITTPFFPDLDRPQHIIQDMNIAEEFEKLGLSLIESDCNKLYRTYRKMTPINNIIRPSGELGQHFLVDKTVINLMADQVMDSCEVLEVGAGDGRLTKVLVQKASKVIAVEIDKRYKSMLTLLSKEFLNLKIIIGNVLDLNLNQIMKPRFQIISSLPYQISGPFLRKLIDLDITNAVLLVGDKLGRTIRVDDTKDPDFSWLTLLVQVFFEVEFLGDISKKAFLPVPRTNSVIIKLIPKSKTDIYNFVIRELFLTSSQGPLLKNILREIFIKKMDITQNQAREKVKVLCLEDSILNKSFEQLNSGELAIFCYNLQRYGNWS